MNSKKKFHWGHGITLTIASFAAFMGYLAYSSIKSPSFLVREDYYQAELEYTKNMEAEMRGNAIEYPKVVLNEVEMHLDYTGDYTDLMESPTLFVYSPAYPHDDINLPLKWQEGELIVQLTSVPQGLAYIIVSWEENGESAFQRIVHHFPMK